MSTILHNRHVSRQPLPFATASFARFDPQTSINFSDTRLFTQAQADPYKDAIFFTPRRVRSKTNRPLHESATIDRFLFFEPVEIAPPLQSISQRMTSISSLDSFPASSENSPLANDALTLGSLVMTPLSRSPRQCNNPTHHGSCADVAHWVPTSDGTFIRATFRDCNVVPRVNHAREDSTASMESFLLLTPAEILSRSVHISLLDVNHPVEADTTDERATKDKVMGEEGTNTGHAQQDAPTPQKTYITRFAAIHGTDAESPYVPGRFLKVEHVGRHAAPPPSPLVIHYSEAHSFEDPSDLFTRWSSTFTPTYAAGMPLDLAYVNQRLDAFIREMKTV
jgi:hypothetical protein